MSKRKKHPRGKHAVTAAKKRSNAGSKKWLWILLLLVLAGLLWWKFFAERQGGGKVLYAQARSSDYCKTEPSFPLKYGLQSPLLIDLSNRVDNGLFIAEARRGGKRLQLPDWKQAGFFGPYALDEEGNIYLGPVPHVSLYDQPPEHQSQVFVVNGKTGDIRSFVRLPYAAAPSPRNPFGVMGLAYDCDTKTLYVSTVTGSSPEEERGAIFQVDRKTGKVLDKLEGIDALGVGIFNHPSGKKLYFGTARKPEVFVVDLDEKGHFKGKPHRLFSLQELSGGKFEHAHRIRFNRKNQMEVKAIAFNYTLQAASDPLRDIYVFDYNSTTDEWTFREMYKQ